MVAEGEKSVSATVHVAGKGPSCIHFCAMEHEKGQAAPCHLVAPAHVGMHTAITS